MKTAPAATDRPFDPQMSCDLFRLPPEIRNYIYELVLTVPGDKDNVRITRKSPPTGTVLSLLQTCRLIHKEAHGIFYDVNRLTISPDYHCSSFPGWPVLALKDFLQTIGLTRCQAIRTLTIMITTIEEVTAVLKLVKRCTGLKELYLMLVVNDSYANLSEILRQQLKCEKRFLKTAARDLPDGLTNFRVLFYLKSNTHNLKTSGLAGTKLAEYEAMEEEVSSAIHAPIEAAQILRRTAQGIYPRQE